MRKLILKGQQKKMSTKNENVVDDWECIDDSELTTKVNQIKKNATNSQTIPNDINAGIECSRPFAAMLLNDDDCLRTQYVPPEPTVKILKRPSNDKNNQQLLAEQKPKAPIKTLQQREQEYAEARLRILGSARSEEEDVEVPPSPNVDIRNGTTNQNNINGYSNKNSMNQINSVGNSSRVNFVRNPQPQQYQSYQPSIHHQQPPPPTPPYQQLAFQIPPEMRRIDENVIRLPRGPDGTTGFMLKR